MKISLTPSSFTHHLGSIIFRYHNHIFVYDCDSFYSDSDVRVTILGGCRPNSDQSGMFYLFPGLIASHIAWNAGACLYDCDFCYTARTRSTLLLHLGGETIRDTYDGMFVLDFQYLPSRQAWFVGACVSFMIVITLTLHSQKFLLFWFIYLLEEDITTLSVLLGNLQYLTTRTPLIIPGFLVLAL